MNPLRACLLSICLSLPLYASAQTASGPDTGSKVGACVVHAVTGDHAGKSLDYTAERKDQPTVYVFVRADAWDRPMARFLRTLDERLAAGVEGAGMARAVAVWLTDDASQSKEYLPRAQQSLKLSHTALTVFEGDRQGPGAWGINPDARLTAVVVGGGKVVASFGYQSLNETNVPEIMASLAKK